MMLLKKILYIALIVSSIVLMGGCDDRTGMVDQNVSIENDQDNDGLTDSDEINIYHTNPNNPDTDGDGLRDGEEINNIDDVVSQGEPNGTSDPLDPCDPNSQANTCDTDNDGLTDSDEINIYHTNPNNPDTDGDGLRDGEEINNIDDVVSQGEPNGTSDPLDPCDPNTEAGTCDTDNDGLTNADEINIYHTNPNNPDTDGDGIKDGEDKSGTESTALKPCLPMQTPGYSDYNNSNSIWMEANCDGDDYSNGEEDNVSRNPSKLSDPYEAKDACLIFVDEVYCEVYPADGRVWLDRNLGATKKCESSTDEECYGDYYQWGRMRDGHERPDSQVGNENPYLWKNYNLTDFEAENSGKYDWMTDDTDADGVGESNTVSHVDDRKFYWNDADGGDAICPKGWKVPSDDEVNKFNQDENIIDSQDAYNSPLKLPLSGKRDELGELLHQGAVTYLWTSDYLDDSSVSYHYNGSLERTTNEHRVLGQSVRCIKEP